MNWLINRLKERSTWLAIFALAGLVGIKLEPEFRDAIINAIVAVAAVVAFVFRENTHERSTDLPAIETRSKRVSNLTEEDSVLIGVHSYNELIDRGMRVSESNSKTDLPAIELQGRSDPPASREADSASQPIDSGADLPVFDGSLVQRVRRTGLPPDAFLKDHEQSVRSNQDGYNG
jgi:uncharacterized membrane protein